MKIKQCGDLSRKLTVEQVLDTFESFEHKKECKEVLRLFLWGFYKRLTHFTSEWYSKKLKIDLKTIDKIIDQFIEKGWIASVNYEDDYKWFLHPFFYGNENIKSVSSILAGKVDAIIKYKDEYNGRILYCSSSLAPVYNEDMLPLYSELVNVKEFIDLLSLEWPLPSNIIKAIFDAELICVMPGFEDKSAIYLSYDICMLLNVLGLKDE